MEVDLEPVWRPSAVNLAWTRELLVPQALATVAKGLQLAPALQPKAPAPAVHRQVHSLELGPYLETAQILASTVPRQANELALVSDLELLMRETRQLGNLDV